MSCEQLGFQVCLGRAYQPEPFKDLGWEHAGVSISNVVRHNLLTSGKAEAFLDIRRDSM